MVQREVGYTKCCRQHAGMDLLTTTYARRMDIVSKSVPVDKFQADGAQVEYPTRARRQAQEASVSFLRNMLSPEYRRMCCCSGQGLCIGSDCYTRQKRPASTRPHRSLPGLDRTAHN